MTYPENFSYKQWPSQEFFQAGQSRENLQKNRIFFMNLEKMFKIFLQGACFAWLRHC